MTEKLVVAQQRSSPPTNQPDMWRRLSTRSSQIPLAGCCGSYNADLGWAQMIWCLRWLEMLFGFCVQMRPIAFRSLVVATSVKGVQRIPCADLRQGLFAPDKHDYRSHSTSNNGLLGDSLRIVVHSTDSDEIPTQKDRQRQVNETSWCIGDQRHCIQPPFLVDAGLTTMSRRGALDSQAWHFAIKARPWHSGNEDILSSPTETLHTSFAQHASIASKNFCQREFGRNETLSSSSMILPSSPRNTTSHGSKSQVFWDVTIVGIWPPYRCLWPRSMLAAALSQMTAMALELRSTFSVSNPNV
ncbi:hypothetical protein J1614_011678 [Plenodomus biglobosus]|nr:hypothetical protein J1614_011678 [Plenodomus biglobosus]